MKFLLEHYVAIIFKRLKFSSNYFLRPGHEIPHEIAIYSIAKWRKFIRFL